LDKITFPADVGPRTIQILGPVIPYVHKHKLFRTVRDELHTISELTKDPINEDLIKENIDTDNLKLSPITTVIIQELIEEDEFSSENLDDIFTAFESVHNQILNAREASVILGGQPSEKEVELLENELKAFYYKDMDVDLTLNIEIQPKIGYGRIYCFEEQMLDLTSGNYISQINRIEKQKVNQLQEIKTGFDELISNPLNADLPTSNKIFSTSFNKYLTKMNVACGFAAE